MGVTIRKPAEKTWTTASLYQVYLGLNAPAGMAGCRLVWAVVGYKWVRLCTPITNIKHRMRRTEWDKVPAGDRLQWRNAK